MCNFDEHLLKICTVANSPQGFAGYAKYPIAPIWNLTYHRYCTFESYVQGSMYLIPRYFYIYLDIGTVLME